MPRSTPSSLRRRPRVPQQKAVACKAPPQSWLQKWESERDRAEEERSRTAQGSKSS